MVASIAVVLLGRATHLDTPRERLPKEAGISINHWGHL